MQVQLHHAERHRVQAHHAALRGHHRHRRLQIPRLLRHAVSTFRDPFRGQITSIVIHNRAGSAHSQIGI